MKKDNSHHYREVNLDNLCLFVKEIANNYSSIQKISLFRGTSDFGFKYVVLAIVPPFKKLDEKAQQRIDSGNSTEHDETKLILLEYYNDVNEVITHSDDWRKALPEMNPDDCAWVSDGPEMDSYGGFFDVGTEFILYNRQDEFVAPIELRPNQQAKIDCRKAADKLWNQDGLQLRSKEMATHKDVQKYGRTYTVETVRRWICDLAPDHLRKPGRSTK